MKFSDLKIGDKFHFTHQSLLANNVYRKTSAHDYVYNYDIKNIDEFFSHESRSVKKIK